MQWDFDHVMKSIFACPTFGATLSPTNKSIWTGGGNWCGWITGYGMNLSLPPNTYSTDMNTAKYVSPVMARIKSPALTPWYAESRKPTGSADWHILSGYYVSVFPHGNRANYAYADGHIEALSSQENNDRSWHSTVSLTGSW